MRTSVLYFYPVTTLVTGGMNCVINPVLLLARHAGHCNTRNDFALEDSIEQKHRRRRDKGTGVGQPALNVAALLNEEQSHRESEHFTLTEDN